MGKLEQLDLFAESTTATVEDVRTAGISAYVDKMTFGEIVSVCQHFENHHGRWPNRLATAEQFVEAGVNAAVKLGISGKSLSLAAYHGTSGMKDSHERELMWAHHSSLLPDVQSFNPRHWRPFEETRLTELLGTVQLSPMTADFGVWIQEDATLSGYRSPPTMKLTFPLDSVQEIVRVVGGIYDPKSEPYSYYFELLENRRLHLRYGKIIGSRLIGILNDAQIAFLNTHLKSLTLEKPRATPQLKAPVAAPAPPSPSNELQDELLLLSTSSRGVELPVQQLKHYAGVKALLTKAGGRYVNRKGAHFVFPVGTNVDDVLEKLQLGDKVNDKKKYQFYATPQKVASSLCDTLGPLDGKRVLDPSAGHGALAQAAVDRGAAEVVTVELWNVNALVLREKGFDVIERDFLELSRTDLGQFDAIIANPPFTKNLDIKHFCHMLTFLKPGGSISALLSPAWIEGDQGVHRKFRELLALLGAKPEALAPGAFKESGTDIIPVRISIRNYQPDVVASILGDLTQKAAPSQARMKPSP